MNKLIKIAVVIGALAVSSLSYGAVTCTTRDSVFGAASNRTETTCTDGSSYRSQDQAWGNSRVTTGRDGYGSSFKCTSRVNVFGRTETKCQ